MASTGKVSKAMTRKTDLAKPSEGKRQYRNGELRMSQVWKSGVIENARKT